MKFTVREGFVIHDTRMVKQGNQTVEQTNSYYGGDAVDFDEDTAKNHLHKLEPADKAAAAFAQSLHAPTAAPVAAAGMDAATIAQIVAQAVTAALAAQAAATAQAAEAAAVPDAPAKTKG